MNYLAIIVCGIISMIIGSIWYGPLFGKKWMEICGVTEMDKVKRKEMQKKAMPLYLVQFVLTLLQLAVLSWYISTLSDISSGVHTAFSIWLAFILPTIAGTSMWNNDSSKVKWARFFIQVGYQLVVFIVFGLLLSAWH